MNSTPSNKIQISNKTKIEYKKNFFIIIELFFFAAFIPFVLNLKSCHLSPDFKLSGLIVLTHSKCQVIKTGRSVAPFSISFTNTSIN